MPGEERIGITIDAKSTGGGQMREHIQTLDQMNAGWKQFNDLRREAAEQFPDDLRRQNAYIQQQLNMYKELETVGSRERIAKLRHERMATHDRRDRERIDRQIRQEGYRHIEEATTFAESRAARMQWALDQGIGEPSQRDMAAMLTEAGVRGGLPGLAQAGLGTGLRALTAKMAGMGTLAKVGLGVGGGLAIAGGYTLAKGVFAGKDIYKEIAPELAQIMAMTGQITSETQAYREELLAVSAITATSVQELIQLEKTWNRILGRSEISATRRARFTDILDISQAYGIEKQQGIEFSARMAMTGYAPAPSMQYLKTAIIEGLRSGIGEGRLPEFIREVQTFTQAVMQTAVTTDPALMARYAGMIGTLGEPFRGERGGQILGAMQRGITGGGMGFQAARRVLERSGKPFTFADVAALQQQGMNDPRMMAEMFGMAGEFAGRDLTTQAWILEQWMPGIPMRAWYNPDEGINSLLELRGKIGPAGLAKMTPEELQAAGVQIDERVAKYKGEAFGFEVLQTEMATQVGKIETAALAFEKATGLMHDVAMAFAGAALETQRGQLGPEFRVPPDEAVMVREAVLGGMSLKEMLYRLLP